MFSYEAIYKTGQRNVLYSKPHTYREERNGLVFGFCDTGHRVQGWPPASHSLLSEPPFAPLQSKSVGLDYHYGPFMLQELIGQDTIEGLAVGTSEPWVWVL